MDQKIISDIQSEMYALKVRASKVGFKDKIPTLPVFKKEHPYAHESQLMGFKGRLRNWERCLNKLEFVNPKPTLEEKNASLVATIELPEGVKLIREV
jgi:hypothetical protein